MVVFVVLIDCQATLGEWTLMTSHSSGNGPLSRMGDMAAWEPWCLNWPKRRHFGSFEKIMCHSVIIMTLQKVGRLAKGNPFMNLHLRKVKYHPEFCILGRLLLKEDNSATQMLWYIILWFSNGFKGDFQTSKENTNLKFESQSSDSSLFFQESGTFLLWFFLSF